MGEFKLMVPTYLANVASDDVPKRRKPDIGELDVPVLVPGPTWLDTGKEERSNSGVLGVSAISDETACASPECDERPDFGPPNVAVLAHEAEGVRNPKGCIPTDVWSLPSANSKMGHYAAFPSDLVKPLVEACTLPADLVLDPFAGSGTTCIVAAMLGRRWLGIELNPEYAAMAESAIARVVQREKEARTKRATVR